METFFKSIPLACFCLLTLAYWQGWIANVDGEKHSLVLAGLTFICAAVYFIFMFFPKFSKNVDDNMTASH